MSDKPKRNPLLFIVPIIAIVAVIAAIELLPGGAKVSGEEKTATLTVQKAEEALHKINQGITVDSVAPSPIKGIWEVIVTTPQGKKLAYIDTEGKYLISGSLVELASGTDLTKERAQDLNKVDFASIALNDAVVLGNPNAAKKVVVFDDPD